MLPLGTEPGELNVGHSTVMRRIYSQKFHTIRYNWCDRQIVISRKYNLILVDGCNILKHRQHLSRVE